jgi:hypothetical protein
MAVICQVLVEIIPTDAIPFDGDKKPIPVLAWEAELSEVEYPGLPQLLSGLHYCVGL